MKNFFEKLFNKKRKYPNTLPDPIFNPKEFNNYLIENNKVIFSGFHWILIENSYIKNQLVVFYKHPAEYLTDTSPSHANELYKIITHFKAKAMYVNAKSTQSVNRFHLHIKL